MRRIPRLRLPSRSRPPDSGCSCSGGGCWSWDGGGCRKFGSSMSRAPDVRPATDGDYRAVIALLEATGLPTAGVPRTLGDFLVADAEDGLAGAIGLERYGSAALLRSAAVRPG